MLLEELFLESPLSIAPVDFNLDDPVENKNKARALLSDGAKADLEKIKGYQLVKVRNQFALIDESAPRILYYVQWQEIRHRIIGKKAAAQIKVWRSGGVTAGIAAQIFFEKLLPLYGVMITDTEQSPDGRRFWSDRIANAFTRGLKVYYLNLMQDKGGVAPELTFLQSYDEFEKAAQTAWGDTDKFHARKFLISQEELAK